MHERYVAFIRAINVAGHGSVRMPNLRNVFERAGARQVRTVIQTGNVLFEAPRGSANRLLARVDLKAGRPVQNAVRGPRSSGRGGLRSITNRNPSSGEAIRPRLPSRSPEYVRAALGSC